MTKLTRIFVHPITVFILLFSFNTLQTFDTQMLNGLFSLELILTFNFNKIGDIGAT